MSTTDSADWHTGFASGFETGFAVGVDYCRHQTFEAWMAEYEAAHPDHRRPLPVDEDEL
jgi:hypothetical protein